MMLLTHYIKTAMEHAVYQVQENGSYFGEIPQLSDVWASGQNLEECRERLQDNLEYEMLVALTEQKTLPDFGENTLNLDKIDQPTDIETAKYQAISRAAQQQETISLKSILPKVSSSA